MYLFGYLDFFLQPFILQLGSYTLGRGMKLLGSHPCRRCSVCPLIGSKKEFVNPSDGERIVLQDYVNCRSRNVIYALMCDCPKMYVGQTPQELRKRIQQHLSNITLAKRDRRLDKRLTPVALHFLQAYGGHPDGIRIFGLSCIKTNIRGGDLTGKLLRTETRWIHCLKSVAPLGLNEEMLFTGFYKK